MVFLDAIRIRTRDEGMVRNKAVHVVLGIRSDGSKEVLGLWTEQNEGAKFWLRVMNELRGRGLRDILIAVVDGLKGFPDALRRGVRFRAQAQQPHQRADVAKRRGVPRRAAGEVEPPWGGQVR